MKVKQLKKFLEKFDDNLEVVTFVDEMGEFFPVEKNNVIVEDLYVSEYGELYEFDTGMRLYNKMGQLADENTSNDNIKKFLVIS